MDRSRRKAWWVAGAAAAAVVVAVAVPVVLLGGDATDRGAGSDHPGGADGTVQPQPGPPDPGTRWIGLEGVEVQVPERWPLDTSPTRPDCIGLGMPGRDRTAPDHPYVEVVGGGIFSDDVGCFTKDQPSDMPDAFGPLPVDFWEPHVTLAIPMDGSPDGSWEYDGWTLTRKTVAGVQVVVLASPDRSGLAEEVVGSLVRVETDHNMCPTTSPVQEREFQVPSGPRVPEDVRGYDLAAVCQYSRIGTDRPGLIGSTQLDGPDARALIRAVNEAPSGSGPNRPDSCVHDEYGESAIELRFYSDDLVYRDPPPHAYVYYDWCFGNGVVDASGNRQLTTGDCRVLFVGTVRLQMTSGDVWPLCAPQD